MYFFAKGGHMDKRLLLHALSALCATLWAYSGLAPYAASLWLVASLAWALRPDLSFARQPANWLTALRLALVMALPAAHWSALVVALASMAALALDGLDGYVARRTGTVSKAGVHFDVEADALMIWAFSTNLYQLGLVGAWIVLVAGSRFAVVLLRYLLFRNRVVLLKHGMGKIAYLAIATALISALLLPPAWVTWAVVPAALLLAYSFLLDFYYSMRAERRSLFSLGALFSLLNTAIMLPGYWGESTNIFHISSEVTAATFLFVFVGNARVRQALVMVCSLLYTIVLTHLFYLTANYYYLRRIPNVWADIKLLKNGLEYLSKSSDTLLILQVVLFVLGILASFTMIVQIWAKLARAATALRPKRWLIAFLTIFLSVSFQTNSKKLVEELQNKRSKVVMNRLDLMPTLNFMGDVSTMKVVGQPDVWFFVLESYGACLLDDAELARDYLPLMTAVENRLVSRGYQSFSGSSLSTSFGGMSWLPGSTLLLGSDVADQEMYEYYVANRRKVMSAVDVFKANGYQTLSIEPLTSSPGHPGNDLFHFDSYFRQMDLGGMDAHYGYALPDQYTMWYSWTKYLKAQGGKLNAPHFVQLKLGSTHAPWDNVQPLVHMTDFGKPGAAVKAFTLPYPQNLETGDVGKFMRTVAYDWEVILEFLERYVERKAVLVFIGDHQPHLSKQINYKTILHVAANDPELVARLSLLGLAKGMIARGGMESKPHRDFFRGLFHVLGESPVIGKK